MVPSGKIETLAKLMQAKKEEGEEPFVLVLGAGASLSSGSPGMDKIIARIQEASGHDLSTLSEEGQKAEFYNFLDNFSADHRYLFLKDLFKNAKPSVGYLKLAELAKKGYFQYILTTNFDQLLEKAFKEMGMTLGEDYVVCVVGRDKESQILRQLSFSRPPVKVLKLHGDLSARIFKFTPKEIFEFPEKLEAKITELLSQDFVIVGHSMRDTDLNRCIRRKGGAIWYVNPEPPQVDTLIWQAMRVRKGSRYINETKQFARFDTFFTKLHSLIMKIPSMEQYTREDVAFKERDFEQESTHWNKALQELAKVWDNYLRNMRRREIIIQGDELRQQNKLGPAIRTYGRAISLLDPEDKYARAMAKVGLGICYLLHREGKQISLTKVQEDFSTARTIFRGHDPNIEGIISLLLSVVYQAQGTLESLENALKEAMHAEKLLKGGNLEEVARQRVREINSVRVRIPLLDKIVPSPLLLSPEYIKDYIQISPECARDIDFAWCVKGNSMAGVNLKDGDIVLIHSQSHADKNSIVVVRVAGQLPEFALKCYHYDGQYIHLWSEPEKDQKEEHLIINKRDAHKVQIVGKFVAKYETVIGR